jgi:hypothetical protein
MCADFARSSTFRDETALQPWACEAEVSQIPELIRFVQRLRLDWEAVENALLEALSQGQVEGQVHRLKVGHRDKAMDAPVLASYKLAWWKQATSTASAHDVRNAQRDDGTPTRRRGKWLSNEDQTFH